MGNLDPILIFKTSICNPADRDQIRTALDGRTTVLDWSVDLEDIDCVLRVVSDGISAQQVVALVSGKEKLLVFPHVKFGFHLEILSSRSLRGSFFRPQEMSAKRHLPQ